MLARSFPTRLGVLAVLGVSIAVGLTACGSADDGASGGTIQVEAGFYPLAWVTEQVGGDRVGVASLTPPGAEPHELELSPKDVGRVQDADLVVLLSGFQPAVDDAAASVPEDQLLDAADATELDLELEDGVADPHFWLDPTKLAEVATAVGDRLSEIDPSHASEYAANAKATVAALEDLDRAFSSGLADCTSTDLVTSHAAFGYLADRYGFEQLGISGLSPTQEPTPAQLAAAAAFVEERDVRTIYFETLVPEDLAQTVAEETGADTAVLDPVEGITDESAGTDYLGVMEANLATLQAGQGCA